MRVDALDLVEAARAAVPSLYRPHPRYRPAVTGVAGARLLLTLTVNCLNQAASETLLPPASRTGLTWARGGRKTCDCRNFGQRYQRSALGKPRTSRTDALLIAVRRLFAGGRQAGGEFREKCKDERSCVHSVSSRATTLCYSSTKDP